MERDNKRGKNIIVKTIIFILILALTFLMFFGLGNETKTNMELISFFVVVFGELLIFLSTIIPNIFNKNPIDILSASCLYTACAIVLNYMIKLTTMKELIVWNIALFIIYLILLVILIFMKKKNSD